MTALDKIKAEIEQIKPYDLPCDKRTPQNMLDMVLEIINRYADQEPSEDMSIAYLMGYYADKEPCEITTLEQIRSEIKAESYHEDCYGDSYPSSSMVVNLADVLRIVDKYSEERRRGMDTFEEIKKEIADEVNTHTEEWSYVAGLLKARDIIDEICCIDCAKICRDRKNCTGFVDALVNPPGTWSVDIDKTRGWDWRRFYCSECGKWQTYGILKFCPNCGSEMMVNEDED